MVDLFGELNGGDLQASFTAFPPLFDGDSGGVGGDGLFSLGVRATPGSSGVFVGADAFGIALECDTAIPPNCTTVQGPDIAGTVVTAPLSIPEPTTMTLLAIGFAGIAFLRRKID